MTRLAVWVLLLGGVAGAQDAASAEPIRVMLLDGESGGPYHDWPAVSSAIVQILTETGLFEVFVETLSDSSPADFELDLSRADVVVMNYDAADGRWPDSLQHAFEAFVSGGGGLVAVHAADNAFPGWTAFNRMIGIGGWRGRDEDAGPYWYFQDDRLVADRTPGPAGSHGRREPFLVDVREPEHPIMQGLPPQWMHGDDELYAHLRGPGTDMTVLATAYSDPANAGSGRHEPQLLVLGFGSGRVFHFTFGHDVRGLSSMDSVVLLQRGTEWAATGTVSQVVPEAFPGAAAPTYYPINAVVR